MLWGPYCQLWCTDGKLVVQLNMKPGNHHIKSTINFRLFNKRAHCLGGWCCLRHLQQLQQIRQVAAIAWSWYGISQLHHFHIKNRSSVIRDLFFCDGGNSPPSHQFYSDGLAEKSFVCFHNFKQDGRWQLLKMRCPSHCIPFCCCMQVNKVTIFLKQLFLKRTG
jgi:hypothetical protein